MVVFRTEIGVLVLCLCPMIDIKNPCLRKFATEIRMTNFSDSKKTKSSTSVEKPRHVGLVTLRSVLLND